MRKIYFSQDGQIHTIDFVDLENEKSYEDDECFLKDNTKSSDIYVALKDNSLISLIKIILDEELKLTDTQIHALQEIEQGDFVSILKKRNVGATTMLIYYVIASILYSRKPINIYIASMPSNVHIIFSSIMTILNKIKIRYPYFLKKDIEVKKRQIYFNDSTILVGNMESFDYEYNGKFELPLDCLIIDELPINKIDYKYFDFFKKIIYCRYVDVAHPKEILMFDK